MTEQTDWLDYTAILGGKVVAEIEKWTKAYEAKRISKRELFIVVSALYEATSGIAPEDVRTLMASIHEELRAK